MKRQFAVGLLALLILVGVQESWSQAPSQADWTSLFDGRTLNGWRQENGTATYAVENGAIVGRSKVGSPNSFLVTEGAYADFELELELFADTGFNSGIQIRSRATGTTRPTDPSDRVNGPQVEVESSGVNGAEAGYIYGEASGGWLTPPERLKPHRIFRDLQWNRYRIVARGSRIQTYINDILVEDITLPTAYHETYARGFIGLQVHSVGERTKEYSVRWRNIRIRELS